MVIFSKFSIFKFMPSNIIIFTIRPDDKIVRAIKLIFNIFFKII